MVYRLIQNYGAILFIFEKSFFVLNIESTIRSLSWDQISQILQQKYLHFTTAEVPTMKKSKINFFIFLIRKKLVGWRKRVKSLLTDTLLSGQLYLGPPRQTSVPYNSIGCRDGVLVKALAFHLWVQYNNKGAMFNICFVLMIPLNEKLVEALTRVNDALAYLQLMNRSSIRSYLLWWTSFALNWYVTFETAVVLDTWELYQDAHCFGKTSLLLFHSSHDNDNGSKGLQWLFKQKTYGN